MYRKKSSEDIELTNKSDNNGKGETKMARGALGRSLA